jgi:hypothetical protein
VIVAAAGLIFGQTQVDLRTQSKDVDFSQAMSVLPFPTGTIFPSTCKTGAMFFKSDAAAGANLYACVSPNVWTPVAPGGGGGEVPYSGATADLNLGTHGLKAAFIDLTSGGTWKMDVLEGSCPGTAGIGMDYTLCMESGLIKKVSASGAKTVVNLPTGICSSGQHVAGINADLSVNCTADSGGGGADALDQTVVLIDQLFPSLSIAQQQGWAKAGSSCVNGGGGATASDLSNPFPNTVMTSGGDNALCMVDWPGSGDYAGNGLFDFISGSSPLSLDMRTTIRTVDQNGDFWVGMMSWSGAELVGCRYKKSANLWQAAIVSAGSDVAAVSTGVSFSAGVHHIRVTNSANSITCTVDGTSKTVVGTIPGPTGGGWVFVSGSQQRGSTPTVYGIGRVSIKVSGIAGAN